MYKSWEDVRVYIRVCPDEMRSGQFRFKMSKTMGFAALIRGKPVLSPLDSVYYCSRHCKLLIAFSNLLSNAILSPPCMSLCIHIYMNRNHSACYRTTKGKGTHKRAHGYKAKSSVSKR